jgi:hypothetical protein
MRVAPINTNVFLSFPLMSTPIYNNSSSSINPGKLITIGTC